MPDRSHPLSPRPARSVIVDMTTSPRAALRPLSLTAAHLDDVYWAPRRHINRTVTLPEQYRQLDLTGRLRNFQRAAGQVDAPYAGRSLTTRTSISGSRRPPGRWRQMRTGICTRGSTLSLL